MTVNHQTVDGNKLLEALQFDQKLAAVLIVNCELEIAERLLETMSVNPRSQVQVTVDRLREALGRRTQQ
jgi:hypothetical protein